MCADTIELRIRCIGCLKGIETASEAEMNLFRNGVPVHNQEECIEMAACRLEASV